MGLSKYEAQREANIKKNQAILEALDLKFAKNSVAPPQAKLPRKRRVPPSSAAVDNSTDSPNQKKKPRYDMEVEPAGLRRSRRASSRIIDYSSSNFEHHRLSYSPRLTGDVHLEDNGNHLGKRIHDPKTFGHIPGIEVGRWWETRAQCSTDSVHAPFVAGISGDSKEGAYSVALSGGYDDDVDLGYAFTFTGSGGRDLKGTRNNPKNLRTGPQSCNQSFENRFNKSLQISVKTKRPVRVIRGYKLTSKFAPLEGYRYDGLYTVEKAWIEPGLNDRGFLVCKFAFKRLEDQPAIPERTGDALQSDAQTEETDKDSDNTDAEGEEAPSDTEKQ